MRRGGFTGGKSVGSVGRTALGRSAAKKVEADGMTFASKLEYRRYCELKILERAGKISDLRCQVPFELLPTQREPDIIGPRGGVKKGRVIELGVTYYADFVYIDNETGEQIVEDAKGYAEEDYKLKRKMVLYFHGIRISEINMKKKKA